MIYIGSASKADMSDAPSACPTVADIALANRIMSESVPVPRKALHAHRINRELSFVYPMLESIRSRVADHGCGPDFLGLTTNMTPVISQHPSHRPLAHSKQEKPRLDRQCPHFMSANIFWLPLPVPVAFFLSSLVRFCGVLVCI